MDNDLDLIPDLMNSLADARVVLKDCLSNLPRNDKTNRQRVMDTIKEMDDARLKILIHLAAKGEGMANGSSEPPVPRRPSLPPTPSRPRPPSSIPPRLPEKLRASPPDAGSHEDYVASSPQNLRLIVDRYRP